MYHNKIVMKQYRTCQKGFRNAISNSVFYAYRQHTVWMNWSMLRWTLIYSFVETWLFILILKSLCMHLQYFLFICKSQNLPYHSCFSWQKQIRSMSLRKTAHYLPRSESWWETLDISLASEKQEKVYKKRMPPCTQLNKGWKISLMQQRGALCHFHSIWRDCIKGITPEVRPHSLACYYFRLSVSH